MADRRPTRGRPEGKTPRPKKKPANAKKAAKRRPKKKQAVATATPKRVRAMDPSAADDADTRFIQPYQATKTYLCPGCLRDIPPGMGHMVAVPPNEPDLRRHWHRGCWSNRHNL